MSFHQTLIQKLITSTIVLEQYTSKIPNSIQVIFGALGQFNLISFIEIPIFTRTLDFTIIFYFSHPHIYLILTEQFTTTFIIIFCIVQLFLIIWLLQCIRINSQDRQKIINQFQIRIQSSIFSRIINIILCYGLFLLRTYFGNLLLDFCFYSLLFLPYNNIPITILSGFLCFQLIIVLIIQWQFTNRSIKFIPQLQYLTINQSYTMSFNFILILLQQIIFYTAINKEFAKIAQSILIILNFIHKFLQLSINKIFMRNEYQQMLYFFCVIGISIGLFNLLNIYQSISLRLWIVILPLLLYICNQLNNRSLQVIFLNKSIKNMSISSLKYLATIVYDQYNNQQVKFNMIIYQYFVKEKYQQQQLQNYFMILEDQPFFNLKDKTQNIILHSILEEFINRSFLIKNTFELQQIYMNHIQLLIALQKYVQAQQIITELKNQNKMSVSTIFKNKILHVKTNLNSLYELLTDILNIEIISKMKFGIVQSQQHQAKNREIISKAMMQLTIINQNNITIVNSFKKILIDKIEFLQYSQSEIFSQKIFNRKVKIMLNEMQELLNRLFNNYENLPTLQNQSALVLYQVEVLNDILNAYLFGNTIALDEEIMLKHHKSELFNFLNSTFNFMIYEIKDAYNISITSHSINQQILQIKNIFNSEITNNIQVGDQLKEIIPESFILIHQNLVEEFLEKGINKFVQQIGETYIRLYSGVIQVIDICMDLNFYSFDNFQIVTIYRQSQQQKQLLIIDQQFKLVEVSYGMLKTQLLINSKQFYKLIGSSINKIIPNFKKYIDENNLDVKNCKINLVQNLNDEINYKTITSIDEIASNFQFICHLQIFIKIYPNNQLMYVAQIDDIKLIDRLNSSSCFVQTIASELQDMDEDIEIDNPDLNFEDKVNQHIIVNTDRNNTHIQLIPDNFDELPIKEKKQTETSIIKYQNPLEDQEMSSNISSIAQIRKSQYYKKFETIQKLVNSHKQSNQLIKFKLIFIVYIIYVLSYTIKLLVVTNSLTEFISHITLISIKNEIYRPIEAFMLTRYTIVAYNSLLSRQLITSDEYQLYITFSNSNIASGYDDLKVSIMKVLEVSEFQPFLKGNYEVVYLYQKTNTGQAYNLTFRTDIQLMLNYQYEYLLAYTVKPLLTDSAYSYYSYKDYMILFDKFVSLRDYTLDQSYLLADDVKSEAIILFYIFITLAFILILYQSYLMNSIRQLKNKILTLIKNQDLLVNENEIIKLKNVLLNINDDKNIIYNFKIDLEKIDQDIKSNQQFFKQKQYSPKKLINLKNGIKQLLLYLNYLLFFSICIAFYELINQYVVGYKQTAKFYSQISDAEIQILIVYAWKEALYYRSGFTFLSNNDIQAIIDQIMDSLDSLQQFTQLLVRIDSMDQLFGSGSTSLFSRIILGSICDNLNDDYKEKSAYICPLISQGTLTEGILASLNYMISNVRTEYATTQFLSRTQPPKLELEGAALVSNVIEILVNELQTAFQDTTQLYQQQIYIFLSIFILIELFSLIIMFIYTKYEQKQLDQLRKFIFLIPSGSLFYDEHFIRVLKGLALSEQLT